MEDKEHPRSAPLPGDRIVRRHRKRASIKSIEHMPVIYSCPSLSVSVSAHRPSLRERIRAFHLDAPKVIVLSFLLIIFIGTILLSLPLASSSSGGINFIDALFTATSATCVTGLVVLDTGKDFSLFGQGVILSLIQLGGLGLMTISTIIMIILGKRIGLRERIILRESTNLLTLGGVVGLIKLIVIFTAIVELSGFLFLFLCWLKYLPLGKAFYFSLFHSISAFCNAGFSLFSNSLMDFRFDWRINLVVCLLIIIGGLGFYCIYELRRFKSVNRLSLHTKLVVVTSLLLILSGGILLLVFEYNNSLTLGDFRFEYKLLASFFQSITARTAGFNTLSIGDMNTSTLILLMVLMFVGGSPGSTAGGIKTTTFIVLILTVFTFLREEEEIHIFGRTIPHNIVIKSLALTVIALAIIVSIGILMNITEKQNFIFVLFEIISAFGTVGLSTGITPNLSLGGKLLIIVTMFVGRIGPITFAYALFRKSVKQKIKYPEEKIMIG